jgi:hypothetical protein
MKNFDMEDIIKFSYNWNNKLNCKVYTTFRLFNEKYQYNKRYKIYLKEEHIHDAIIEDMKIMKLDQINRFIAGIDTGYSVKEFKNIVLKMYGEKAKTANFLFILLKKID